MKLLSVVIITRNRANELVEAMRSCEERTTRNLEFVIVDNNSTDNTEDLVRSYSKSQLIKITYIRLDNNTGVSFARNIGYQAAGGDILFFIDDDAFVNSASKSLDIVCDYMRDNDDVFACTGESIDFRFGGKLSFARSKTDRKEDMFQIISYVGFNHFIKKGFSDREYLYPNNLFYGAEELYVGLSVIKYGGKVTYIHTHSVQHNPSNNTRIDRREGIKNGHINTYVIKKYFLKGIYKYISTFLFMLRIARFCKFNAIEMLNCFNTAKERYDKKYDNRMTIRQIRKLISQFGWKAAL